jgi:hypothetical protein
MRYLRAFCSDDDYDWLGAPVPFRWVVRLILAGSVLAFLYHLVAGSL